MPHADLPRGVERLGVSHGPTDAPVVALTFDDGPDPAFTPAILDILDDSGIRATFFMIGRAMAQHPTLVAEVVRRGHVVANHTQDHLWLTHSDATEVRSQMQACADTMAGLGLAPTRFFRPPRGLTSPVVEDVVTSMGSQSYFWGTCLEANLSHHGVVAAAALTAMRAVPGSIILCHDGGHLDGPNPQSIDRSRTVEALPGLISFVLARQLRFVTLPQLFPHRAL